MDDDGWEWPTSSTAKKYKSSLISFMSYFHNKQYDKDKVFTKEELLQIRPRDIHNWMALKAFGKTRYDVDAGDKSTGCRLSTLDWMKKALSYYMPYKRAPWVEGRGNPSRSDCVNNLMGIVKKLEARGQGAKSQVKRPLTQVEFCKEQEQMRRLPDWEHKYKYPAMNLYQFHLCGRADDTCHFKLGDLKGNRVFPGLLQTKVRWSKNVIDERRCPDQIIMGAMDPLWCVFIHMAVYMEIFLNRYPNAKWLFTEKVSDPDPMKDTAPDNMKATWRNRSHVVSWDTEEFQELVLPKVGLNGNKPAEQFTRAERNVSKKVAVMYGRRNAVWQLIKRLMDSGHRIEVVLNRIHTVYGWNLSVTQIIKAVLKDKKTGGHPNLR